LRQKAIKFAVDCLEQIAMNSPVTPTPAAPTQDESICLEAHGLLNQSYDALDALLLGLAHVAPMLQAEPAAAPEVTIVGQGEALPPAHLFL
jgi:hypothetical protein